MACGESLRSGRSGKRRCSDRAPPARADRTPPVRDRRRSSAMIAISVGPASRSIPHRPNNCRLASATYLLPAPQRMSTARSPPRPNAISANAGTPPTIKMRSAPAFFMALMVAGKQPSPLTGGVHAMTVSTSGHLRGNDAHLRRAEHRIASAGNVAANRVAPGCACGPARPRVGFPPRAATMSPVAPGRNGERSSGKNPCRASTCSGRDWMAVSISPSLSSKLCGFHPSNFSLYSAHGIHAVTLQFQQHFGDEPCCLQVLFE